MAAGGGGMLSPRSRLQARSARADKCGVVTCIQDGGGLFFFLFFMSPPTASRNHAVSAY